MRSNICIFFIYLCLGLSLVACNDAVNIGSSTSRHTTASTNSPFNETTEGPSVVYVFPVGNFSNDSTNATNIEEECQGFFACESKRRLLIGATFAIVGNLLISFSFIATKKAHNSNTMSDGSTHQSYTKIPIWWAGLVMMAVGEVGNFMAYGFGPATLVSPLGAVAVISNTILSHFVLKETLTRNNLIGCACALAGSVLIVLFSPTAEETLTMPILLSLMSEPVFIVFLVMLLLSLGVLVVMPTRLKEKHVVFYVLICALTGAISVMCIKGVSTAVRGLFNGDPSWFESWLTYVLILTVGLSIFAQMRYLNLAMISFGSSQVVPVYFVLFSISSIMAGVVLYKEFHEYHAVDLLFFLIGVCMTFGGVYLINKPVKTDHQTVPTEDIHEDRLPLTKELQVAFDEPISSDDDQLV